MTLYKLYAILSLYKRSTRLTALHGQQGKGEQHDKYIILSCGHVTEERFKNLKKGMDTVSDASVNGSNVISINSRLNNRIINKNSSTKYNGVCQNKNGTYRAHIKFKRKQYHLGTFNTLEGAVAARKEAEEKIYGNFIDWYKEAYPERWKKISTVSSK